MQMSIPDERRWLLVLIQLERARIAALTPQPVLTE